MADHECPLYLQRVVDIFVFVMIYLWELFIYHDQGIPWSKSLALEEAQLRLHKIFEYRHNLRWYDSFRGLYNKSKFVVTYIFSSQFFLKKSYSIKKTHFLIFFSGEHKALMNMLPPHPFLAGYMHMGMPQPVAPNLFGASQFASMRGGSEHPATSAKEKSYLDQSELFNRWEFLTNQNLNQYWTHLN